MTEFIQLPYVGPRTFRFEDRDLYFGRRQESRELLATVVSHRLVLFHAPSGAGKSSLLNTIIVPGLKAKEFFVLPVGRVGGALPEGIASVGNVYVYNLLLSLDQGNSQPQKLSKLTLSEFLEERRADVPDNSIARMLIIDQFEEIVTTQIDHWEERQNFFEQIRQAYSEDARLWILLAMREDQLAALERYTYLLPDSLRIRFQMQRMTRRAALESVREPAKLGGRPFADGVAENLVDNLRQSKTYGGSYLGEFVEPVQLQVVCYQLWANLRGRPFGEITQSDLDTLGDVDSALARFYEHAIGIATRQTKTSELDLRNWFDNKLITQDRTRGTVYRGTADTGGLSNDAVRILEEQYLLRSVMRAGGTWYELVHDRFVTPILQSNEAWRKGQGPVLEAAESWERSSRNPEMLYEGSQLRFALSQLDTDTIEPLVRDFLSASEDEERNRQLAQARELEEAQEEAEAQRKRLIFVTLLSVALIIVTVIAVTVAIFAFGQYQRAEAGISTAAIAVKNADNASMDKEMAQTRASIDSTKAADSQLTSVAAQEAATAVYNDAALAPTALAQANHEATRAEAAQLAANDANTRVALVATNAAKAQATAVGVFASPTATGASAIDATSTIASIASFDLDCIPSDVWSPQPQGSAEKDVNNCWQLADRGIRAQEDGIAINISESEPGMLNSIYSQIEGDTTVEFDLVIDQLWTPTNALITNISFGILPNSLSSDSGHFIYYQKESPQEGYPVFLKHTELGGIDAYMQQEGDYIRYPLGSSDHVVFRLEEHILNIYLNGYDVSGPIDIPFTDRVFWIGYRVPVGGAIDAKISNFRIEP